MTDESTTSQPAAPHNFPYKSVGVILFYGLLFFAMSDIKYSANETLFPFRINPKLYLWFPMLIPMGIGYGLLFRPSADRDAGRRFKIMIATSIVLMGLAAWASMPSVRVRGFIGGQAMAASTVERFTDYDSYNGGRYQRGVLRGPPHLIHLIAAHRGGTVLKRQATFMVVRGGSLEDQEKTLALREVCESDGYSIVADPQSGRIYFARGNGEGSRQRFHDEYIAKRMELER
jgi:hypothetical protein